MSWFLKHKRTFSFVIFIIWFICLYVIYKYVQSYAIIFWSLSFTSTAIFILNEIVYRKYKKQTNIFSPFCKIRNFDVLIICDNISVGNLCDLKNSKVLILNSYKRTLKSSFEILKSTHSILAPNKNSKVIFALNSKYIKKEDFSIFDVFFFNTIAVDILGLNGLKQKQRFPMIFEPIKSIANLLPLKRKILKLAEVSDCFDIKSFCQERGYQFNLYLFD